MATTKLAAAAAKTAEQKATEAEGKMATNGGKLATKPSVGAVVPKKAESGVLVANSAVDFEADAGMGLEGADKDSFALPFLAVLQGLSPQLETVDGAKPGLIINTVTNELFTSVRFVPVAFQRRYNRWMPRSAGGGFKGTMTVGEVETLIANGEAQEEVEIVDGKERTSLMYAGTQLKDTRNHFVLVVDDDGAWHPALLSLASTQIKKSKRLMALIQGVQESGKKGKFNPPSFSRIYEATTVDESNASGKWKSFEFALVDRVSDPVLYNSAKEFHAQVTSGAVQVSAPPQEADPEEGAPAGKF